MEHQGFLNTENHCYIHSLLHIIFNDEIVCNDLLAHQCENDDCLAVVLKDILILKMKTAKGVAVKLPPRYYTALGYKGQQADVQEVLALLTKDPHFEKIFLKENRVSTVGAVTPSVF